MARTAPLDALEGAPDQELAGLGEDLDGHVLGNSVFFDQLAREVEVGLRRGREADLDFLEAHVDEGLEHVQLAPAVHRVDERLVAVAQVDAAPHRSARDGAARPLPIRQVDRLEPLVLLDRHPVHGVVCSSRWLSRAAMLFRASVNDTHAGGQDDIARVSSRCAALR